MTLSGFGVLLMPEVPVLSGKLLLHKGRVPAVAAFQGMAPKCPTAARRREAGTRHCLPHAGRQARQPVRKVFFGELVVRKLVVAVYYSPKTGQFSGDC